MAKVIFSSDKFELYELEDPIKDQEICKLGYWSLRDPEATKKYLSYGPIYLLIDKSKPLLKDVFDFINREHEQVIGFQLSTRHYRNRVNLPFDLKSFFEKHPELKEVLKVELEKFPLTDDYLMY